MMGKHTHLVSSTLHQHLASGEMVWAVMATLIASVLIHRSLYDVSCCVVRCGPRCKGLCLALFCRWRQARWRSIKVPAPEVILSSTSNPSQQILHRIHSSVFHPDLSLSQYSPLPFSLLIFHPHQFSHSSIMVRPQQKKPRIFHFLILVFISGQGVTIERISPGDGKTFPKKGGGGLGSPLIILDRPLIPFQILS